jgi:hypothetical protein
MHTDNAFCDGGQIREEVIELPLPEDADLPPTVGPNGEVAPPLPSPYVRCVQLLMICGRVAWVPMFGDSGWC